MKCPECNKVATVAEWDCKEYSRSGLLKPGTITGENKHLPAELPDLEFVCPCCEARGIQVKRLMMEIAIPSIPKPEAPPAEKAEEWIALDNRHLQITNDTKVKCSECCGVSTVREWDAYDHLMSGILRSGTSSYKNYRLPSDEPNLGLHCPKCNKHPRVHTLQMQMSSSPCSITCPDRIEVKPAVSPTSAECTGKEEIMNFPKMNFSQVNPQTVKMSMSGIAQQTGGKFVAWDAVNKTTVDVTNMVFDFPGIYIMPVQTLAVGDLVSDCALCAVGFVSTVRSIRDFTIIDLANNQEKNIVIPSNMFGLYFVHVIKSFVDPSALSSGKMDFAQFAMLSTIGNKPSGEGKLDPMTMAMMMGGEFKNNPMVLMALLGQGGLDPMALIFLMGKDGFKFPGFGNADKPKKMKRTKSTKAPEPAAE